ncbi:MAG: F0F1 ATP synthase subunit alpha [Bacilli bacterium]|nr:F0F1 ATP synthase subunit alpha [Bacilli bacterium]
MDDIWTSNLNDTIDSIKNNENVYNTGKVIKVNDYNVEVTGLNDVAFYEEVNVSDKASGYVFGIYPDRVIVALVKINEEIKPGDMVYALKKEFKCLFSLDSVGKVIDVFGNDLIAGKKFDNLVELSVENRPISLMDRGLVKREMLTGITGIDLIYPIGKGQRQLIIGDKKTGKTQLCLDTIVNQKDKNVLCIYVAIGKTKKEVKDIYYELTKRGAASYTIIIASFHDELPTRTYLTPYVALSIAESFMLQTYDVLVCLDDLKKHADIYRQISLASKKTPGRDAYPSDIFYTHSRLLEKGCQHKNGGSITILPIVETKAGDITDYISTNIISICDGQIVLSAKNFAKGEKPAIDYGLSVSRLGGNVQDSEMKKVGSKVRIDLLSYLDVRQIYELANIDEMSEDLQRRLKEGKIILDNLRQYKFSPKTKREMIDSYKFLMENKQ